MFSVVGLNARVKEPGVVDFLISYIFLLFITEIY